MFKKAAVTGLMLALALTIQPASAAKKKKPKKPKPYKTEQVTLAVAHPIAYGATYGETGSINLIVAKELEQTCATPHSNGTDAWAFEVPAAFQKYTPSIDAIGASVSGTYDLDMYFYDKACKHTIPSNSTGTDEFGLAPKGTAWVVVHNYVGEPGTKVHLEIKA